MYWILEGGDDYNCSVSCYIILLLYVYSHVLFLLQDKSEEKTDFLPIVLTGSFQTIPSLIYAHSILTLTRPVGVRA